MNEFASKLNGFKKFKTETSDTDLFDMMKSARPNGIKNKFGEPAKGNNSDPSYGKFGFNVEQEGGIGDDIRERGINTNGYSKDTPIGKMNDDFNSLVGKNKGLNPGGNDFVPTSTDAQQMTKPASPSFKQGSGYSSNDGQIKAVRDNVTNNVSRGIEQKTGAGINNQRSFVKQPGYGQKDLTHIDSNKSQKVFGGQTNTNSNAIGNMLHKDGFGSKPKNQLGRGIITQELFGKVGDNN